MKWDYVAYATKAIAGYPYHAIRRVPEGDRPVGRVTDAEDARREPVRAPRAGTHHDRPEPEVATALVAAGLPVEVGDVLVRVWRFGGVRGPLRREQLLRWLEDRGHAGFGFVLDDMPSPAAARLVRRFR